MRLKKQWTMHNKQAHQWRYPNYTGNSSREEIDKLVKIISQICRLFLIIIAIALVLMPASHAQKTLAHKHSKVSNKHCVITAYCLQGRTSTGTKTRKGICAVNTRHIPLGSTIIIPRYGRFVAEDKLPNASKAHIDIWMPSRGECRRFGRRKLQVIVIQKDKVKHK